MLPKLAIKNIIEFLAKFLPVPLTGIKPGTIKKIRLLCDGSEVPISDSWVHTDYPDIVFANLGPDPVLPDAVDTVLEVELTE